MSFTGIFPIVMEFLDSRFLLRVGIGSSGIPPLACVTVVNRSRTTPAIIHAVRIHHGSFDYTYSFQLPPFESITISPKDRKEFILPNNANAIKINHHLRTRTRPELDMSSQPSFDHPRDLFRAIKNGGEKDSWVEIDFNEFERRIFCKGKVKELFQSFKKAETS